MNIHDLINLKEKKDLESKITDKYEINYGKKNPFTPITIQGATYKLKTEQYESLIKILKETDTKMEEIRRHDEVKYDRYFGITIDNKSITRLQINNYELEKMPKEIGQLTELKTLNLISNQLTKLPKEIGQLTQLSGLYLNYNKINELPKEIGQLTQLRELWLPDNQIKELPKEIGQLTQLKTLWSSNNQIKELPKEIGQLTQLEELFLSNNQINTENEIVQELRQRLKQKRAKIDI